MVNTGAGGVLENLGGEAKGPLALYSQVSVGRKGFWSVLRYDGAMLLGMGCPGWLGQGLRRWLYAGLFQGCGNGLRLGQHVVLRRPGQITLGDDVMIDDQCVLSVRGDEARLVIGNGVHIGRQTMVSCAGGELVIEEGVTLGSRCRLGSLQGLTIGKDVRIDDEVCITGAGHAFNRSDLPVIKQEVTCKGPTVLGAWTHIGRNATIMDGVTLGKGVLVTPGAMVNSDWGEGVQVGGVPAKEIQEQV